VESKRKIKLNPKNYKSFYKSVADDCEVHVDLVDDLISFFYGKIRSNLESLDHSKILVPNLGTFNLRKARLDHAIKRNKDILGNMAKTTYKGYDAHVPVKEKIELFEKAAKRLAGELKEKKDWRNENR
jgi:nucleoid DNA-binding protein